VPTRLALAAELHADADLMDTHAQALTRQAGLLALREGAPSWPAPNLLAQAQRCATAAADLRRAARAVARQE
jgi:hypothetical protein